MNHVSFERLALVPNFVLPFYDGRSIANVPPTIAHLLKSPIDGASALADDCWRPLGNDISRVVLLIIDGFGLNLYRECNPSWFEFDSEVAIQQSLTSIFPSTTVAALSSLWTGVAPAQHGMLGLKMFFPEFASAGQMLKLTPVFGKLPDALVDAGLEVVDFLNVPGFAEQLGRFGVRSYAYKGNDIVRSALSQMHGRGLTEEIGVSTFTEMLMQIRTQLEKGGDEPLYINGYWPTIDTLSHLYTWKHEIVMAELKNMLHLIRTVLVEPMSKAARSKTALFIVADHGQTVTPPEKQIYLSEHPDLKKMLLMRPIGEPRVLYLYAKQGLQTAVLTYINEHLGHAFVALSGSDALEAGLFGLGQPIPEAEQRVSDVVAISKDGYTLLLESEREKAIYFNGRHGSLTADEMQVPWLGYRLG